MVMKHAHRAANSGASAVVQQDVDARRSTDALRGMDLASQEAALAPEGPTNGGDPATDGSAWATVVCRNFRAWDADGDGRITVKEAEARVASGADKGDDLVALKGLYAYMGELAKLSEDGDKNRGKKVGVTEADLDVYAAGYPNATPATLATLDARFASINAKATAEADYGLYGKSGQPDASLMHQGMIGTCYFLAPMIALAERDPNAICNMIVEHPPTSEGAPTSYTVTFPNQPPVTVTLGDGELRRLQASTGENGVWPAVLERAFIAHNWAEVEKGAADASEAEQIKAAEGGFAEETIPLLTGNEARRILLKGMPLKKIDALLTAAVAKGAIMACAISKQWWKREKKKPLPDQHEYALLGYANGLVTVRNPHGAGTGGELMAEDGTTAADGVDDGEFSIDLESFRKMFSDMTIEQR